MVPSSRAGTPPPLRSVANGRWGTFVYGTSRPLVSWLAHAMALAAGPDPVWIDFRRAGAGPDPMGPVALGRIPANRLYIVGKSEAKLGDPVSNNALFTVIRSDEPKDAIAELTDFLRLPPPIQEVINRGDGNHPTLPLVVANTDRIRDNLPDVALGIRLLVNMVIRANMIPICASLLPDSPAYLEFDLVFRVQGESVAKWREGSLYCEKAPARSGFAAGQAFPLESLPEVSSVLNGQRF